MRQVVPRHQLGISTTCCVITPKTAVLKLMQCFGNTAFSSDIRLCRFPNQLPKLLVCNPLSQMYVCVCVWTSILYLQFAHKQFSSLQIRLSDVWSAANYLWHLWININFQTPQYLSVTFCNILVSPFQHTFIPITLPKISLSLCFQYFCITSTFYKELYCHNSR